jgi:hypothetical protein
VKDHLQRTSLKDLVRASDIGNLGADIGSLVVLNEYRRLHPDYNPEAVVASLLKRVGLPSLEEKKWDKDLAIEMSSPYIMKNPGDLTGEQWVENNRLQIKIGGLIKGVTELVGGRAHMYVFADDVHQDDDIAGKEGVNIVQKVELPGLAIITHVVDGRTVGSVGGPIGEHSPFSGVILESRYREEGRRLVELLQTSYPERIKGEKRKRLKGEKGEQDVYLWEKDKEGVDTQDPSCDVLDLAHRRHMSETFHGGIILAPERFLAQQQRVIQLERLVGEAEGRPVENVVTALTSDPVPVPEPEAA